MKHPERINYILNVLFSEWCVINFKNTHLGERLLINFILVTVLSLPIVLLSSCSKYSYSTKNISLQQHPDNLTRESEKYLKIAENSKDPIEKNNLLLLSAELLISANNIQGAEKNLNELNTVILTPSQHAVWQILLAKINLMQTNIIQAKALLANISSYQNLENDVYKKLYTTKYEMFLQTGEVLEAIQEQVNLEKFLTTEQEININHKNIWDNLQQLTPNFLRLANQGNFSQTMQGWLTIAYITKQYDSDQSELSKAMMTWQKNFPNHPANTILDLTSKNNLTANYNSNSNQNQEVIIKDKFNKLNKIALLLPLSGPYNKSAIAIKNGFLAASYNKKSETKKPEIIVLDTHDHQITNVYKQAIKDGADLIVGPLIKEDLERLSKMTKISIPVLALNTLHNIHSDLLFQFGLPPEVESRAIVEKARDNHHKNALFIVQNNDLGKRMLHSISNDWQLIGGNVVTIINFNSKTDLNKTITTTLGIEDSNNRAKELSKLGIKFNFEPRRRQDIDCVFLITNATNARQIKPLLNFYYASKIPVYATSSIYTGIPNPSLDRDLDGIQFCDIPWMLDASIANHSIYQSVKSLWKENFAQYSRLYALGIDAYKLSIQMPQLLSMPEVGISGMTGILKINNKNVIYRKLMWGTFENGLAVVLNQKN